MKTLQKEPYSPGNMKALPSVRTRRLRGSGPELFMGAGPLPSRDPLLGSAALQSGRYASGQRPLLIPTSVLIANNICRSTLTLSKVTQ